MALTKAKASNILLTTPAASSNDVTPATTEYVTTALANLVDSAPSTLNTLNELAAALGDDANFSTTVTNSIAGKLPLAGGSLTGNVTLTKTSGDALFKVVTGGGYDAILELDAPGASGAQSHIKFSDSGTVAGSIIYTHNSGGTDFMTFGTGGNNTTALTIDSSQNVGIGTTPAYTLEVKKSVNNDWISRIYNEGTTDGSGLLVRSDTAASQATAVLGVYSDGAYRMMVRGDGKVGIGTSSPSGDLHILTGSTNTFTASNDSWHTIVLHNNAAAATNTTGIAFEVSGSGYHGNAGTGIAAVKNGTNSDYGADLAFITRPQAAVAVERMRISDTGNVGIGTTDPKRMLQVGDNSQAIAAISLQTTTSGLSRIYMGDNDATAAEYAGMLSYAHSDNTMQFFTSQGRRMVIDADGRVLIGGSLSHADGYSTPGGNSGENSHYSKLWVQGNTYSGNGDGRLVLASGTAWPAANVALGQIFFSTSWGGDHAAISCYSAGQVGSSDYPGYLRFDTTEDGASSPTERMTIGSNGRVNLTKYSLKFDGTEQGKHEIRTGGRTGTGTYTLFTNGSSVTQSAGIVEVWGIYGTPSGASYRLYVISGNRSIVTAIVHTQTNSVPTPTLSWNGAALQITNSNGSLYYHVRVTLHDIGNAWAASWGNFPGMG